jgi:ABC-type nitrate/sulfonate/bicarbonate transport system substrate-binding protein
MRRLPLLLLAIALLCCHRSQSGATVPNVRIAIHRDPIAFLPVRVAQTLGYYAAERIAVDMSEVAGGASQSRDRTAARARPEARHAMGTRSPGGAGSPHDS